MSFRFSLCRNGEQHSPANRLQIGHQFCALWCISCSAEQCQHNDWTSCTYRSSWFWSLHRETAYCLRVEILQVKVAVPACQKRTFCLKKSSNYFCHVILLGCDVTFWCGNYMDCAGHNIVCVCVCVFVCVCQTDLFIFDYYQWLAVVCFLHPALCHSNVTFSGSAKYHNSVVIWCIACSSFKLCLDGHSIINAFFRWHCCHVISLLKCRVE